MNLWFVYHSDIEKNYNSGVISYVNFFKDHAKKISDNIITIDENAEGYIFIFFIILPSDENMVNKIKKLRKKNKLLYFITDTHSRPFLKNHHLYDKILVYDNTYLKFVFPEINLKSIVFTWIKRFDPDNYINYTDKLNKAIIYGCNNGEIYPLRNFLISNKNNMPKLDVLEHTGWNRVRHNIRHKQLINYLNGYKIIIITTGRFPINYLVYKYIEAFSTNSLVICEYTEMLDKLGFKPYEHYIPIGTFIDSISYKNGEISFNNNINNINALIDKYINDIETSSRIGTNGYNLANIVFSYEARKRDFEKIMNLITHN